MPDVTLAAERVNVAGRLHDASLAVAAGRLTAIVGANGAGKSTLAKVLAGLIVPDAGAVKLDGTPLAAIRPRDRARAIGYLAQGGDAVWNVAARELVGFGRLPHGDGDAPSGRAAVAAALASADVAHLADRPVHAMSGGERARVLLARVIAGEPAWLIADEPLANLDPPHQAALLRLLRARAAAGCGVVAVLHDLNAALRADHVVVMRGGSVIAAGPAAETLTAAILEQAFGMAFRIISAGADTFIAATR
jgi:iron complex transport system ATP-binding protein